MLTRDEARAALVSALEARPLERWVARELALTLARLEYGAGARDATRRAVDFYTRDPAGTARLEHARLAL